MQHEKVRSVNWETILESPEIKKKHGKTSITLTLIKDEEWLNLNPLGWRNISTYHLKNKF